MSGYISITRYPDYRFTPHWHTDPELTIVLEGQMTYQIDGQEYLLKKGQAIYTNANCFHSAWDETGKCVYMPINFNPSILFGYNDSRIYKKYVERIINSPGLPGIILDPEKSDEDRYVIERMISSHRILHEKKIGYELVALGCICDLWSVVAPRALQIIEENGEPKNARQISRIKKAIDYIDRNYKDTVTLDDLSVTCGLSRSELCRCFKSVIRQSPMEYVTWVRIHKSLPLLASREHSITEVAELCGFSGSSYFAEMFKRHIGYTPSQYIKKISAEINK